MARVKLKGKSGFIDKVGKVAIPIKYDEAFSFSEGSNMVSAKLDGKYGFIDKLDKTVIPFEYDSAYYFSEGLADVKLNDKYNFVVYL